MKKKFRELSYGDAFNFEDAIGNKCIGIKAKMGMLSLQTGVSSSFNTFIYDSEKKPDIGELTYVEENMGVELIEIDPEEVGEVAEVA